MTTNERKALRRQELDALKARTEYATLSTTLRQTLHLIATRWGAMSDDGFVYATVETLAKARKVSVRTMKYHLAALVSEGWLVKNPGGRKGPSTGGRPINGYMLGLHERVHESLPERLHIEVLRTGEALRADEPLFERNVSILTDACASPVERDLLEGVSPNLTSLISTDRGEPQPLIGVSAQRAAKVMSAGQREQAEYDDAFAATDLDPETFDGEWLRDHPGADVKFWSGIERKAAHALGVVRTDDSTQEVLST